MQRWRCYFANEYVVCAAWCSFVHDASLPKLSFVNVRFRVRSGFAAGGNGCGDAHLMAFLDEVAKSSLLRAKSELDIHLLGGVITLTL